MLREFFVNEHPGPSFKMFGLNHLLCVSLVIASLILIYFNRNKISNLNYKVKRIILVTGACILLLNMLIYTSTNVYYGIFDYKIHLPLHLCFISNYLFIYGILFKNEKVLKLTFFLSFIGPIPAILWPELPSCFDYYKFWEYFTSHHIFIILSFFSYYALNYKVEFKNFIQTFIFTNILIFLMMPFNYFFQMNYIYSSQIPPYIVATYPFLKYFNPLITIEVTGLIIGILIYQIARIRNRELLSKSLI